MMTLITSLIQNQNVILTDYHHSEDENSVNIIGKSKNGEITFINGAVITNDTELADKLSSDYELKKFDKYDALFSGAKHGDIMFHANNFKKEDKITLNDIINLAFNLGYKIGSEKSKTNHDNYCLSDILKIIMNNPKSPTTEAELNV